MTHQEILALDGPSLTRLAWDLNLDPRQDSVGPPVLRLRLRQDLWQPHVNLAQADAVFRQLRVKGWDTFQGYDASQQFGWVTAYNYKANATATWECQWRMTEQAEEPLALLRVSVLAIASAWEETP